MTSPRLKVALVLVTAALLVLSLVGGPYPRQQSLQHLPTVLTLALLAFATRRAWPTRAAFCCLVGLLWLHILGARWIYSFVPYDEWTRALLGSSLSETFGWERNHYDRFVHLCFGALCVVPAAEIALRYGRMTRRWAAVFGVSMVMTLSALYETFEWGLTVVMSPADAEAYNGQQGDFWDAQKDMALALLGSLLAVPLVVRRGREVWPDSPR